MDLTKQVIGEREAFLEKTRKARYACPHCRKRFRATPMRTAYSVYPACPRCGVPVAEACQVRFLDRTRKVLRWASLPVWAPAKFMLMLMGLSFITSKVGLRGAGHGLAFLFTLPLKAIGEYRKSRFASPEELEHYLQQVKSQWKGGVPPTSPVAPVSAHTKAVVEATKAVCKAGSGKVRLSVQGKAKFADGTMHPHNLKGVPVRSDKGLTWVRWFNGNTGGPYRAEELEVV